MLLVALFFAVGASRSLAASFKSDWKTALKSTPTNSIVGAWEGEWKSIAHKVHGPLKCVIKDLGNGQYEAHFYAQFHWFHFTYAAKLVAEKSADQTSLKGEADLGWMGGLYKYAGQASPDKYFSSYKSPVENGVLELQRPKTA
jgi:hypothetical protein